MPTWTEAQSDWIIAGEEVLVSALAVFQPLLVVSESSVRFALRSQLAALGDIAQLDIGQRWEDVSLDLDPSATVVGLGGGAALDWAKLVASVSGMGLVLAPTAASTNSIFTPSMRSASDEEGVIHSVEPTNVVLDLDVISKAPHRINAAGLADALAVETALLDWMDTAARDGVIPAIEQHVLWVDQLVDSIVDLALGFDPSLTAHCLEVLRLLYEGVRLFESSGGPLGAGYEHLFAWNLERVTGRQFIHGEAVALGIVLAYILRERNLDVPLAVFDTANVMWRPSDLGVDSDELVETVDTVSHYNRNERNLDVPLADEVPNTSWRDALRLVS